MIAFIQSPAPQQIPSTHFYADWTFWQWIIASLALILSQLPPLASFIRKGKLKLDAPSKIQITHKAGNPNLKIILSLRNIGERDLQIRSVHALITRSKFESFSLKAQQIDLAGGQSLLFMPFPLSPKSSWTQSLGFYNDLDRQVEKEFRSNRLAMQQQIRERLAARKEEKNNEPVKVDGNLVDPFLKLFEKQFKWNPGEYTMELTVETTPSSATLQKTYRFTLFESDTDELKEHLEEYWIGGGGITFAGEKTTSAWATIQEDQR